MVLQHILDVGLEERDKERERWCWRVSGCIMRRKVEEERGANLPREGCNIQAMHGRDVCLNPVRTADHVYVISDQRGRVTSSGRRLLRWNGTA